MRSEDNNKPQGLIKVLAAVLVLAALASTAVFAAPYILNNRDTRPAPEAMPMDIPWENKDEYIELFENETFVYHFKEDNMILAVTDKRNDYTWTSGIDIMTNRDIDNLNDQAEREGTEPPYPPKEDRLNTIYTGIANSLVTLEYYDSANNLKIRSISKDENVRTEFRTVAEDHYLVSVDHREPEVAFNLHIRFTDEGLNLSIPREEIEVPEDSRVSAFYLSPFLGSTGGIKVHWDEETEDYSEYIPNDMKPGYVLVPDGSGALIRFRTNSTSILPYEGQVYGVDASRRSNYYDIRDNTIPLNHPVMPVYGIAHGSDQNAFVAYAPEGGEYLEIIVQPEENMTNYYYAYPRFEVNNLYFQAYNKKGDGFFRLMDEPNPVDISMNYDFLAGDGSDGTPAANYVGMAQRYREHLIGEGQLRSSSRIEREDSVPLRLDFIMADAKKGIIGYRDEVLTTAEDVEAILTDLQAAGIGNINAGLLGWQDGGFTLGSPSRTSFNGDIGSRRAYSNLLDYGREAGIDLSFMQDYLTVTEGQIRLSRNVSRHVSGFYNEVTDYGLPLPTAYYARPDRSAEWLGTQSGRLSDLGTESYSISGISNRLVSDYADSGSPVTRTDAIAMYREALQPLTEEGIVALDRPNSYLWEYTDRYLQAPVYSSQQLIQTDNVPFLQMVLGNSMEVYGPYSNFSFYTRTDILRMIDYNTYPSFVLTAESAHLLSDTNLVQYYSTEYSFYESLISEVYSEVNEALQPVAGAAWTNREVLAPGVIRNSYQTEDGGELALVINYTEAAYEHEDFTVAPADYTLISAN